MSEVYGIVYCAVFPNEKKYIGQTTKQLQKRINEHKHHSSYDEKRYLYRAMRKYGFENIEWLIIKECETKTQLDFWEKCLIELFHTRDREFGYNSKEGGSYGKHSEETKKIISEGKKGKKNPMYGKPSWNKGKKLTQEHVENLSKSHIGQVPWNKGLSGMPGTPRTEETKMKISEKNSGEKNGNARLNWNIVREIRDRAANGDKLKDIAKHYGLSPGHVSQIVNNKMWKE